MISRGLFEGLVSATTAATVADSSSGLMSATTIATTVDSLSGVSVASDCCTTDSSENSEKDNGSLENIGKEQFLLPSQILVPHEMKLSSAMPRIETIISQEKYGFVIPEGRVHGGGLLSLLGGSIRSPGFSGRI